ncbi:titin homolog isoform X2 [Cephus cinctus]|uniref:Titin homolog isoform X2 n=1 Tax=Cephus cinctus TaxID=211228 RepID=A0AAJ7C0U0_CEPCN|nr:titin homolog isoform X2 [Cephus cinctus]
MGLKRKTAITWSVLELTGLLEDEDSRVYFERTKRHLGLHPFHLTDLNAALHEILSSSLNKYDPELKGILLSYQNPKLLNCLGDIFYDTCYVHVDIEADFYVFRPDVPCNLRGIVNKKSDGHVGVLVHKAFNVSIPKPEDDNDWPGNKVSVGQEVKFTVSFLDFKGRLPYIRGVFDPDEYLQGCRIFDPTVNIIPEIKDGPTKKKSQDVAVPRQNKRVVFSSDDEQEEAQEQVSPKKNLKAPRNKIKQIMDSEEEIDSPKKQTSKSLASELKTNDSKSKSKKSKKETTPSWEVKKEEEETKTPTKKLSKKLLSKVFESSSSEGEKESRQTQLKKTIKKSKMSKHQLSDSESEVEMTPLSKKQSKKSKTIKLEAAEMSNVERKPTILTPVISQDSDAGEHEEPLSRSPKKQMKKSTSDDTVMSSRALKYERKQDSDIEEDDLLALKSVSKKQSIKSKRKNSETEVSSENKRKPNIYNSLNSQDSESEEEKSVRIPSPKKSLQRSINADSNVSPTKQMKKSKISNETTFSASETEEEKTVQLPSPKKSLKKSKNLNLDMFTASDTETKHKTFKFLTSRESDTERDVMPPPPQSSPKKQLKKSKNANSDTSISSDTETKHKTFKFLTSRESDTEKDEIPPPPQSSPKKQLKKSKNANSDTSISSDTETKHKTFKFLTSRESDTEKDEIPPPPQSSPKKQLKKSKNANSDTSISSNTETKHRTFKFLTSRESDTEKDEIPPPPQSSPKKQLTKSKVINRSTSSESEADEVLRPKSSSKKSLQKPKNKNSDTSAARDSSNMKTKSKNLPSLTESNYSVLTATPQSKSTKKSTKTPKTSLSQDSESEREEVPEKKMSPQSQSQELNSETAKETDTKSKKVKKLSNKTTSDVKEKQNITDSSISKKLLASSKSAKSSNRSITETKEQKQVESAKKDIEEVDGLKGTKRKKKRSINEDLSSVKKEPEVEESLKQLPKVKKIKTEHPDASKNESPVNRSKMSFFNIGEIVNSTPIPFTQKKNASTGSKKNVATYSDSDSETDENESINWRNFNPRSKKNKSQNREIDNFEKGLKQRLMQSSLSIDDSDTDDNSTASPNKSLKSLMSIKKGKSTENRIQFKEEKSPPPQINSNTVLSPSKPSKRKRKNTMTVDDSMDEEAPEDYSSKDIFKGKKIKVEPKGSDEEKLTSKTKSMYENDKKLVSSPKKSATTKQRATKSSSIENSKNDKKKNNKSIDNHSDHEKDKVNNSRRKYKRILDPSEDNSTDRSLTSPKKSMAYRQNTNTVENLDISMQEEKLYLRMKIKEEPL